MTERLCPRERDVLVAVSRAWRVKSDEAVAAHADACARCAGVRAAAELLRAEHLRQIQATRVPSGAAMWWRLERRLRQEQARRAQRIALGVQAVVLACAAGVAAAVIQIASPWLRGTGTAAFEGWTDLVPSLAVWANALASWAVPVAMLVAAWLVLVPAAVYLGLADD